MSRSKKALIGLFIATILWSTTYYCVLISLKYVPPFTLAFLRGVISIFLLLIPAIYYKKLSGTIRLIKEMPLETMFLGTSGFAAIHIFQNLGITKTTTSLTALLANSGPIFIFFLAITFLHEKPTLKKTIGLFLGLIGVLIVVIDGKSFSSLIHTESFIGNLLILMLSISWSIYSILTKKISKKFSSSDITLATFVTGTPLLLPFMLIYESKALLTIPSIGQWWIPILMIGYLGFVLMATTSLWNYAMNRLDISVTASFLYLIPIFGIFIGVVFLHEVFSIYNLIGAAFVFLGIYLTQKN